MQSVNILGVPVHAVTRQETIEKITQYIASGKSHQVVTVNPEFVMIAQHDPEFMYALERADLSLADGSGIMWAARFLGHYLPERITGADLTDELMVLAQANGWKVYLIGAAKGVADRAAEKLRKRFPDLKIVGAEEGLTYQADRKNLFDVKEADKLVKRIQKAAPDILLVALGAPKQDLFISRYKKELGVAVMIGVGGSFDFLAGRIRRAPKWLRILALEWLWRLIQEPKRFRRIYTSVVQFPLKVISSRR